LSWLTFVNALCSSLSPFSLLYFCFLITLKKEKKGEKTDEKKTMLRLLSEFWCLWFLVVHLCLRAFVILFLYFLFGSFFFSLFLLFCFCGRVLVVFSCYYFFLVFMSSAFFCVFFPADSVFCFLYPLWRVALVFTEASQKRIRGRGTSVRSI
jgi:hypothetical protein